MGAIDLSKHTINLSKGQAINLSKASAGLSKVMIGLGWAEASKGEDTIITETVHPGFIAKMFGAKDKHVERVVHTSTNAQDIDCDAWVALLDRDGKYRRNDAPALIYYGNKIYETNSGKTVIKHHGDNLTGGSVGDDEQITIDLDGIPKEYHQILVAVTIYRGKERNQSFGAIKDTFIRVVDLRDNFEVCRFDTADMSDNKDAITFIAGKFVRNGNDWEFEAIGKGTKDISIEKALSKYYR